MLKIFKGLKKDRKGYTLTELIVVVAILGILAAVATPMVLNQVRDARINADQANAKSIENAYKIAMATSETGTAPADLAGVVKFLGSTLNPIPSPKQSGFDFYLDTSNGSVVCADADGAPTDTAIDGIGNIINLNP